MNIQNNVFSINKNRGGFSFPDLTEKTDFGAVLEPIYTTNMYNPSRNGSTQMHQIKPVPKMIGRAVTRSDNGEALGVVGQRYGIAENRPIYQMMIEGIAEALPRTALDGVKLTESSSYGGQFTKIELTFDGMGADIRQLNGSSTQLLFKVGLNNSFNGSGSVKLYAGALDLFCTNGCTMGEYTKKAARHTSGFTPEIFAGFVQEQCAEYLTRVNVWRDWAKNEIRPSEAREVLESAGMSGRKVEKMMAQFEQEAIDRGRSVWALYSALTNYSSHNSARFGVRNSGNVDNEAVSLDQREREINRIVNSEAFARVAS